MGYVLILLDEMGLDEMGLDEMGLNEMGLDEMGINHSGKDLGMREHILAIDSLIPMLHCTGIVPRLCSSLVEEPGNKARLVGGGSRISFLL